MTQLKINGKNIQDVIQEELLELAAECSSNPQVVMLAAIRTLAKVDFVDYPLDAACEIESIVLDKPEPKSFLRMLAESSRAASEITSEVVSSTTVTEDGRSYVCYVRTRRKKT